MRTHTHTRTLQDLTCDMETFNIYMPKVSSVIREHRQALATEEGLSTLIQIYFCSTELQEVTPIVNIHCKMYPPKKLQIKIASTLKNNPGTELQEVTPIVNIHCKMYPPQKKSADKNSTQSSDF